MILKAFSEGISSGKDFFQTEYELAAWAKIKDPRKILQEIDSVENLQGRFLRITDTVS